MGMYHRPHDIRHTCVSMLTVAGINDEIIKKIAGHKGQSVTEIVYTHFEIQEQLFCFSLHSAAGCAIFKSEKGKAREAAYPHNNISVLQCNGRQLLGVVGGYFFPLKIA